MSTIKLSVPGLALALAAPLAVAAYALAGVHAAPATAAAGSTDTARTMVMTGEGKAVGIPDLLRFTVAVSVTRSDVGTAMAEANTSMKRVLAALRRNGVTGRDVKTTGLSIDPVYDYSGGHERLTGYAVNEQARATVRDLAGSGKAISAAVAAGGNAVRVNGILLDISDRRGLLTRARDAAMADARTKADEYAAAGGVQLGHVVSLKELQTAAPSQPQPMSFRAATGALDNLAATPVKAGQQELDVTVQVVWALD